MAFGRRSYARCAGRQLISATIVCTSIGRRAARRRCTYSGVPYSVRYVGFCQAEAVPTAWFLRMVARSGRAAGLPFSVHPHMLLHAANDGHDTRSLAHYLGHRNLRSTARYTALAPGRFARFWQD